MQNNAMVMHHKTGVLQHDWWSLWKITSDARKSQRLFQVEGSCYVFSIGNSWLRVSCEIILKVEIVRFWLLLYGNTQKLTAETSVKPNIGLEKFLVFLFLSVCVWGNSSPRHYPIRLKFLTNVYMLCEISCIVLGVHFLNSACTRIYKNISYMAYGEKIFKISFDLFIEHKI